MLEWFWFNILGTFPNPECKDAFVLLWNQIKNRSLPAIRMVDATAKLPVGLLTGNIVHYGNLDECMKATVSGGNGSFIGKHCLVRFPLPARIQGPTIYYQWGACIPSVCTSTDLKYFLKYALHLPAEVEEIDCTTREHRPFQTKEIVTIGIIGMLLVLVILSSIYDVLSTSGKKNKLFMAFSLPTNIREVFDTHSPPGSIDFFNGIRFLGIAMVILGHVYMTKMITPNHINEVVMLEWLSDWKHIWLTSRAMGLDMFFVMGGFFAAYVTLRKNKSGGSKKSSLLMLYVHRYLRLAPAMGIMLLFEATLTNRLGSGPGWQRYSKISEESCENMWWQHMLFINNWRGIEKCMEHTWYLAADFQITVLAPLLIIPLKLKPRIGIYVAFGALVLAVCVSFGLSLGYEEKVDLIRNANSVIERLLYRGTYNRLSPWIMGLLLGYFMVKHQHLNARATEGKFSTTISERCGKILLETILWTISLSLIFGSWLLAHSFIQPDYQYNALESAAYLSLSRVMQGIGICLSILLLWMGYGGIFYISEWKFFQPIGRISYSWFLVHLLVVKVRAADARITDYLSDFELLMVWVSCTVFSLCFAPVLYLLVECPFAKLEKLIFHKEGPRELTTEEQTITSYGTLPVSQTARGAHNNNAFELLENNNRHKD